MQSAEVAKQFPPASIMLLNVAACKKNEKTIIPGKNFLLLPFSKTLVWTTSNIDAFDKPLSTPGDGSIRPPMQLHHASDIIEVAYGKGKTTLHQWANRNEASF